MYDEDNEPLGSGAKEDKGDKKIEKGGNIIANEITES